MPVVSPRGCVHTDMHARSCLPVSAGGRWEPALRRISPGAGSWTRGGAHVLSSNSANHLRLGSRFHVAPEGTGSDVCVALPRVSSRRAAGPGSEPAGGWLHLGSRCGRGPLPKPWGCPVALRAALGPHGGLCWGTHSSRSLFWSLHRLPRESPGVQVPSLCHLPVPGPLQASVYSFVKGAVF